jgi:SAM-dependent methyltransferase
VFRESFKQTSRGASGSRSPPHYGVWMTDPYWNHNVHYHRVVLEAVPYGCERALDIGCGDGLLARKLTGHATSVTGIDRSPEMIRLAREAGGGPVFVEDDVMTWQGGDYDFISCVAVIHHMAFEAAVTRMAGMLRPGGTLVIIGLADNAGPADLAVSGLGLPVSWFHRLLKGGRGGPKGMPIMDSHMTWAEVRQATGRLLPEARFRRRLLWRYSIVWQRPAPAV